MTSLRFALNVKPGIDLARKIQRDMADAQKRVFAAHREAADLAAQQFADALTEKVEAREASRGFASRDTQHLRRALASRGNAPAGASQLGAGYPTFLDKTPAAPYWRNLNEGTSIFVGRRLRVFGPGPEDVRQAREGSSRRGTVRVRRAIAPYRFMEEGARRAENLLSVEMRNIYRRHIPNFDRYWRETFGRSPSLRAGSRLVR